MKTARFLQVLTLAYALNATAVFAGPSITATQDDGTLSTARKTVGSTITYTTTISNGAVIGAGNDATGLMLTNPTPANTTDVGSVTISPIAFDDTYPQTVIPNIGINSASIPYSVFTNDSAGTPATSTIAAYDATSAQGGAVSMTTSGAGIGQFTYNPKAGFTGTDTFTYTISNSLGSSVGTVTINVATTPVIWFVNPSAGSNGTGTLASPFNNINAAVTAIGTNTGQRIFLYTGTATTAVPLKSNGWLIGQGAVGTSFDTVMNITPGSGANARPSINGTRPTIGVASGTGITLADGNNVQGLNVTNSNGSGITGSAVGKLTLADFDVTVTGGSAVSLTTSGTVTATGTSNLTATTGSALNVQNVTIGAAGMTFKSVASNGGTSNGITLDTTGAGSFTVAGSGTTNSGGTIQNKNGTDGSSATQGCGIYLNSVGGAVSLTRMDIEGCQNYGIRGLTVSGGFTLDNSTVGNTTTNGTSTSADVDGGTLLSGEGSVRFNDLTSTATFTNDTFDKGFARTVAIHNYSGTLNLSLSNCTVLESLTATTSSDAILMQSSNAATMNLTVTGSHFTAYRQFAIDTNAVGTSTMNITVTGSDFSNSNTGVVTAAGAMQLGSSGTDNFVTFNINNNTFRHGTASVTAPNNGGAQLVAGVVSGAGPSTGSLSTTPSASAVSPSAAPAMRPTPSASSPAATTAPAMAARAIS